VLSELISSEFFCEVQEQLLGNVSTCFFSPSLHAFPLFPRKNNASGTQAEVEKVI
jgi:hypothetical protein